MSLVCSSKTQVWLNYGQKLSNKSDKSVNEIKVDLWHEVLRWVVTQPKHDDKSSALALINPPY